MLTAVWVLFLYGGLQVVSSLENGKRREEKRQTYMKGNVSCALKSRSHVNITQCTSAESTTMVLMLGFQSRYTGTHRNEHSVTQLNELRYWCNLLWTHMHMMPMNEYRRIARVSWCTGQHLPRTILKWQFLVPVHDRTILQKFMNSDRLAAQQWMEIPIF